jgi:hypothetical protein
VGQAGYAAYDGQGTFVLGGAGADIWGTNDSFRYAYQTLTGDGGILARVVSQDYTDDWAKAGLMIRDSLADNAEQALLAITPANGVAFQYRTATGGSSTNVNDPTQAAPLYLYLARSGTTISAYYSADAVNFTLLGSLDIPMSSTVYIGLAVTSHTTAAVSYAVFDTLYTSGIIGPATDTANTLTTPGAPQLALGTGTGIALNWGAVSGSTGYAVERSSDGANWSQIGTTGAGVTTYNDNGLAGSHRYFYRVTALSSGGGRSAPSAAASLVNRPSAPFNVSVWSYSSSQLIINWRDVSGDTGYRVERSLDGVTFTPVGTVGTNVISLTNSGLAAGTTYYYRVIALSPFGDSPASAVASTATRIGAAPPPAPGGGGGASHHHGGPEVIDVVQTDTVPGPGALTDHKGPGPGVSAEALLAVHALLHVADAIDSVSAVTLGSMAWMEQALGAVSPAFGGGRPLTMADMGESRYLVTSHFKGASEHYPGT